MNKNVWIFIALILLWSCKPEAVQNKTAQKENQKNEVFKEKMPVFRSQPQDQIELEDIDYKLLEHLVHEGVNTVRESEGLSIMRISGVLQAAAKNQNDYQIEINELSHYQLGTDLYSVKERVELYGGEFRQLAENVQFQGFTIRSYGNREEIITNSYQEAADDMVDGWVNSPGHYRNLINPYYNYVGTAIRYSPKKRALFATQVYGQYL